MCLRDKHKLEWLECCLTFLPQYTAKGTAFLNMIVTSDDSLINHYTSVQKPASMVWKHVTSLKKEQFNATLPKKTIMCTVFWDIEKVFLIDFPEHGTTVNSDSYCPAID
jgi:hypothetical protein